MSKPFLICITGLLVASLACAGTRSSRYVTVTATGYCPCAVCCGKWADGKTATGRNAWKSGVAVDPKIIKLGAHLDIPGYVRGPNRNGSWIKADDTGKLIKGKKIDVRFKTHAAAKKWGTKTIKVRVWE